MMSDLNDLFFEQQAKIVAENIICVARSIGWDSLNYATKLIEAAMKRAVAKAIRKRLG